MVRMLPVESVERKLDMKASVLVGNYEFYYAAGKLAALTEVNAGEDTPPDELKTAVMETMEHFVPVDDRQEYLVRLLERFRPDELQNKDTRALFLWGLTGKEPQDEQKEG